MPDAIQPCMGGWCKRREKCPNHYATSSQLEPAERLCLSGQDGVLLRAVATGQTLEIPVRHRVHRSPEVRNV